MSETGSNDRVVVYLDDAGEWRWKRLAPNNKVVADSGEGYTNHGDAMASAERQGVTIVTTRREST